MSDRDALRDRVERAVGALFGIEQEIGRGGMAVVYRATDLRLRRKVALKVLPPELAFREDVKSRFLREAQMAAQLSHPHIVPIFAVDEQDGVVFFAMGLVEGETLAQQLLREPRPRVALVRALLREVAEALAYAHARHVVHRDVKPDNILVERATGRALVSDFGIARAAEGDARLTVTGNAVGTPAYMSPEQAMGERDVDGRADIYALGVVGYQMLAGELPFQAANTPAMLMKHISERPRPLHEVRPDLPANLVYAIERAMGKGRAERWPDASAFRDALAEGAAVERGSRGERPHPAVIGAVDAARPADAHSERSPRFPALPPGWMFNPDTREYGRGALREWREQQELWRERQRRPAREAEPPPRREQRRAARAARAALAAERSPEDRIRRIQRGAVSYAFTVTFLAMINMWFTPRFPWFIFPMIGMGIGLASRIASLWVDGIPVRRIFQRQPPREELAAAEPASEPPRETRRETRRETPRPRLAPADLAGVPPEVLEGPHGGAIRDAAEAKAFILDVLGKLSPADRQMLPEIQPTVDSLLERVRSLVQALHQLDADASGDALAKLERRIAETRAAPATAPDRDRRLQLLERQLATLKDLATRRETVARQLESASLVLQTMRFDLLRLRSSGLESKLDASTGATQEARAVATDIERVIEAANEVRRL